MKKSIYSLFLILAMSNTTTAYSDSKTVNNSLPSSETQVSKKIQAFLEKEKNTLSDSFPYRLNLFKNGNIDKNKAGIRISETPKQFDDLGLSGLLFYYKLYDHSMRVPHWHANAIEVGVVLNGKMKITIWEGQGQARIFTVEKNGTWLIPQASLHALENVGDTELDFIVAYNSSEAADRDFATAWAALPDTMLEKSLGLSPENIATLKHTTKNRLSLFDPASTPEKAVIPNALAGNFGSIKPLYEGDLGSIKRIDENTNPAMKSMAIQQTILNPGSMREPHWYTAGDNLLFIRKGSAFFTMMSSEGKVYNTIASPGDLIFIPVGTFHAYLNIANEPLEVYEVSNAAKGYSEITLQNGARQFSNGTVSSATGLTKEVIETIMKRKPQNYIIPF